MAVSKKKTVKKSKGRPSKFDGINLELVQYMYESGATDVQVAEKINITRQSLDNWKKKHPSFFASLKDWKIEADKTVEKSLYQRACGYTTNETKVFCNPAGMITTHEMKKHYAPDPTSMIFWLKNRQPDKWREKQEVEHSSGSEPFKFAFDLNEKPKD